MKAGEVLTVFGDTAHLADLFLRHENLKEASPSPVFADVYCASARGKAAPKKCALLLFEGGKRLTLPHGFFAECALSCGMSPRDTLTFSSLSEESALLCLTRSFVYGGRLYEPMEVRTVRLPTLSLYQNLTRAFVDYLAAALKTTEEKTDLETVSQRTGDALRHPLLP